MACKPVLNGILWNVGYSIFPTEIDDSSESMRLWDAEFDAMRHIGLDTVLVFTGIPNALETASLPGGQDVIEKIAIECDRCGMSMLIAAGGRSRWGVDLKMPDEMRLISEYIDTVHARYGHHRSFAGWYIDYEFSLLPNLKKELMELYRETVILCKAKSPGLPVVASPFFSPPTETNIMNFGYHEPQEYYDYWSDMISSSHFDVLSLQDNGGQHLSYFEESDTEPYIAAFAKACSDNGCRFWGNVETGEFLTGSAREFTEKYGPRGNVHLKEMKNGWRPVPIERLKRKLRTMSRYSEKNLSWGYQGFYRPSLGAKEAAAYRDYETFLKEAFPEMIVNQQDDGARIEK